MLFHDEILIMKMRKLWLKKIFSVLLELSFSRERANKAKKSSASPFLMLSCITV
jgi:hypothetical protein